MKKTGKKQSFWNSIPVTKVLNGLFRLIFGRTAMILFLLVVQIAVFLLPYILLQRYVPVVHAVISVITVAIVVFIVNDRGNSDFKMAWLLCIMLFPASAFFWLYTKGEVGTRQLGAELERLRRETKPYLRQNPDVLGSLELRKSSDVKLATYMARRVGYPVCRNTKVKYFSLGEEKIIELKRQLAGAKDYIFMEYFIVERGQVWDEILELLVRKVKEGVEVRLMYDGMCSMARLPFHYAKTLCKKGIRCKVFNQIRPFLSTCQNNRDHRKICVIDGRIGFTGGVNIGDEYANQKERFGHWKDTAVMLEGEGVQNLTMMFLQLWNLTEKRKENYQKYLTKPMRLLNPECGFVMPYGDSPYDHENVGEEVYFHIINHAKKYVHIMTPYLILDNSMRETLTRAAKSGIEVQIIIPHIPDKWYAFVLGKTYYKELLDSGIQIYEYMPGFVHAKVFVSDDVAATVGTVNLDYRSLYLHFECGVYLCHNAEILRIEEDFRETRKECKRVTHLIVKNCSIPEKVAGAILRLLAPLM